MIHVSANHAINYSASIASCNCKKKHKIGPIRLQVVAMIHSQKNNWPRCLPELEKNIKISKGWEEEDHLHSKQTLLVQTVR